MDFIKLALITAIAITLYYLLLQWPNETRVYETNSELPIENNVLIENQSQDDFVRTIQTAFIEINLNSKQMASDEPVEIRGLRYVINSNGFNANLRTQEYELIDHVQTIYSPSN